MSYRRFERRADPWARIVHLAYPTDAPNATICSTVTKDHRIVGARVQQTMLITLDDDTTPAWPICTTCRNVGRVR